MEAEPQHDFLERVRAEILAEAERLRTSVPLPRVDPVDGAATAFAATAVDGIERQRLDYAIAELTGSDYVAFVEQAFRAILKRPSDEGGREQQLRLLAHGAAKAEVLGNLRWSPEGHRIGVRVRGLLPRYALAKLGRMRGIGFVVQWMLAFAALPLLLRHQRAADTQAAARHGSLLARIDERAGGVQQELAQTRAHVDAAIATHETTIATHAAELAKHATLLANQDEARNRLELRLQSQHDERSRLFDAALHSTSARLEGMQRREDGLSAEIAELRQHVLAMNHWTTSLQRSLDELEQVAQAAREQADELYAALAAEGASARTAPLAAAAGVFARHLPAAARVLDLGSGDGVWLRALTGLGHAGHGIEPNATLAQRARDAGADVATGDAFAMLGRCADASLDGLALDAGLLSANNVAMLEFARHAARALKPHAPLLLRFDLPARDAASAAAPLPARLAHARALLVSSGFAAIETLGDSHAPGILARRGDA